jgi:hypothetical protein
MSTGKKRVLVKLEMVEGVISMEAPQRREIVSKYGSEGSELTMKILAGGAYRRTKEKN